MHHHSTLTMRVKNTQPVDDVVRCGGFLTPALARRRVDNGVKTIGSVSFAHLVWTSHFGGDNRPAASLRLVVVDEYGCLTRHSLGTLPGNLNCASVSVQHYAQKAKRKVSGLSRAENSL